MDQQRVTALVGAQFGSEGKGLIAEKIAHQYGVHVRTGAPNAGHTYYIDDLRPLNEAFAAGAPDDVISEGIADEQAGRGRVKVVARSVPCGAANPTALLYVGPGGLIDLDLLLEEVKILDDLGLHVSDRLVIDDKAMVIDPVRHHQHEGGVHGNAHVMIGSTGEGVGPARMAKIARGTFNMSGSGPAWSLIDQVGAPEHRQRLAEAGIKVGDVARDLNHHYDQGASILLEGTQGSGLSLVHGPWPYVTSSDTNAAQLAVDAGLAPQLITDVILVARTFPIRVAGNSGPLPGETTWEAIGQPEERTTVTKKVRRVGYWNHALVRRAVMLNRPTEMALTFVDYLSGDAEGCTEWINLPPYLREYIEDLETQVDTPITMLGTGPDTLVGNPGLYRRPKGVFLGEPEPEQDTMDWPTSLEAYASFEPVDSLEAQTSFETMETEV
jgi:adenylosuccinate synthase